MIKIVIEQELMDLNNYINAERSNRFMASKIKKDYFTSPFSINNLIASERLFIRLEN